MNSKKTLQYIEKMPKPRKLTKDFCKCIKSVRSYIKPIRGTKEQAAIAICVKSVLQSKGITLRKFNCRKNKLSTRRIRRAKK